MSGALSNPDLAPVPPGRRDWSAWNIAALWIGMSVCIPTYMLAAGLIEQGMNWWQAVGTVMLGNVYAWFVGLPLALVIYFVLMLGRARPCQIDAPDGEPS